MRSFSRCSLKAGCLAVAILLFANFPSKTGPARNHFAPPPTHTGLLSSQKTSILDVAGKLPLRFEANNGQASSNIKFISRGSKYTLLLTNNSGAVFSPVSFETHDSDARVLPEAVRMELANSSPSPLISGFKQLPNKSNYFIGSDPARWVTRIPNYEGVMCADVYPGIDLLYYGTMQEIEYDFVVRPGSDPRAIRLYFHGAEKMLVEADGDLVLKTAMGEICHKKPSVYQESAGLKKYVSARYVIANDHEICFDIGGYDTSKPLVIDPILQYSTYIGGASRDEGNAIAIDSSGNIYVAGFTNALDSLTTPNAGTEATTSGINSFILKLSADGSSIIYSSYLANCEALGLALDSEGCAYLTGQAGPNFAVTPGSFQTTPAGAADAFTAKLDPTGSSLLYSTFMGGSNDERAFDIAVDSSGNAHLCGETQSTDFPFSSQAFQPAHSGGAFDAFALKLNAAGTDLVYSTYLGGKRDDRGQGIAIDPAGNTYVTGSSDSGNFPTTAGSYDGSGLEFFVTKLNPDGSALLYSVYGLGGRDIAVDRGGYAYLTGTTGSKRLSATDGVFQKKRQGNLDAFAAKLNSEGSDVIYATYIGGGGDDYGFAIAIDAEGNVYVTGTTGSRDFPAVGSLQPDYGGFEDMFVIRLNPDGTAVIYSTWLGGGDADFGEAIAVLPQGSAYLTGSTRSLAFPTANPLQSVKGSGNEFDAFVVRIEPTSLAPRIDSAQWIDKKLFITGENFDFGAKIHIGGKKVNTSNDLTNPTTTLFSRLARKRILPGETVTLRVKNTDGRESNEITFSRPVQ